METQIKVYRTWCKRCLDFKIHKWLKIDSSKALCCEDCKNEENGYSSKDIPEDKLLQQRARYKEMKAQEFQKMFSIYSNPNRYFPDMFAEPSIGYQVIEDDAGQKYIDDKQKKIRRS